MFKVGDIIEATHNSYTYTSKDRGWIGEIVKIRNTDKIDAKTIEGKGSYYGETYPNLDPTHFKLQSKLGYVEEL